MMSPFYLLNPLVRTLILLSFLILLLFNFTIIALILTQSQRYRPILRAFLSILIYYSLLVFLTVGLRQYGLASDFYSLSQFFLGLPASLYMFLLLLGTISAFFLFRQELGYPTSTITKLAIKESIDNLPICLSFSTDKGIVLLANHNMESLSYSLTAYELQDAESLWYAVTEGELQGGAKRLVSTASPVIQLANGETWSFTRRIIKGGRPPLVQIAAINTTDLDWLRMQLQKDNEELAAMGRRLRHYGENIIEVKAREERLATKMRLHDNLGYSLLATQHFLGQHKNDVLLEDQAEGILTLWQRNIAALQGVTEVKRPTALDTLQIAAEAIGIKLDLRGNLPQDTKMANLILTAAGECLTNAVRHARATELYLDILENTDAYTAIFYNNGINPTEVISEGDGLSSLRRKIEAMQGTMTVNHQPRFSLSIILPKV